MGKNNLQLSVVAVIPDGIDVNQINSFSLSLLFNNMIKFFKFIFAIASAANPVN